MAKWSGGGEWGMNSMLLHKNNNKMYNRKVSKAQKANKNNFN